MKLELAEKIVEIAKEYGDFESDKINVRVNYEPRNFLPETAGIVGLSPLDILKVVIENADSFVEDYYPIFSSIGKLYVDEMGKSFIVY